jgi:hypothetical protein
MHNSSRISFIWDKIYYFIEGPTVANLIIPHMQVAFSALPKWLFARKIVVQLPIPNFIEACHVVAVLKNIRRFWKNVRNEPYIYTLYEFVFTLHFSLPFKWNNIILRG